MFRVDKVVQKHISKEKVVKKYNEKCINVKKKKKKSKSFEVFKTISFFILSFPMIPMTDFYGISYATDLSHVHVIM